MADDEFRAIEGDAPARREQMVRRALRDLTANLLRVTRGAGQPGLIGRQAITLLDALAECQRETGFLPDLGGFLTEPVMRLDFDSSDRRVAQTEIIGGALQIAASRLLGQLTQERRGEQELRDGLRRWNEATAARKHRPSINR
jgi:hypothetical protein